MACVGTGRVRGCRREWQAILQPAVAGRGPCPFQQVCSLHISQADSAWRSRAAGGLFVDLDWGLWFMLGLHARGCWCGVCVEGQPVARGPLPRDRCRLQPNFWGRRAVGSAPGKPSWMDARQGRPTRTSHVSSWSWSVGSNLDTHSGLMLPAWSSLPAADHSG